MSRQRAGCRTHGAYTIPSTAVVHIRNGRECYVSGIGTHYQLRYLDDGSFETIGWNEAMMMLPFTAQYDDFKPLSGKKCK